MKSIAQIIHQNKFPLDILDKNGNEIFLEYSDGFWYKFKFDDNDSEVYYEDSHGYWTKHEYDSKGNEIYWEHSNGDIWRR